MSHTSPTRMRATEDMDWDEIRDCLLYLETHNSSLAEYEEWLDANEHVPQDVDDSLLDSLR